MASRRKFLIGAGSSLLVLLLVGVGAVHYILRKSLPEMEGSIHLSGLAGTVEVRFDEVGIPHILAGSEYDMYFTSGYLTARDRLWQMDFYRRISEGRLSEIFGTRTRRIDEFMRTIGLARVADTLYRSVSLQTRNILNAYAAGVNACIHEMKNRYPVEFDILQYEPEAWTPRHSLMVTRFFAWQLALSWWTDLTCAELVVRLGDERASQLLPLDVPDHVWSGVIAAGDSLDELRAFGARWLATCAFMKMEGAAPGSNCWTVTGTRSASGIPILANDPHLMLTQPSIMYLIHMSAPGINVGGASVPGVPGVIIGHNDRIAWGMTNLMNDDVDFSFERFGPGDSTYEHRGSLLPLKTRIDSIFVRDTLPYPFTIRSTRRGPVISGLHPETGKSSSGTQVSMRWAGYELSDEILAIYRLNHAETFEEFSTAFESFAVPGQVVTYADRAGNIGSVCAALVPVRDIRSAVAPYPAWTGTGDWRGFLKSDQLPRSYNPPEELIASANNRIAAKGDPFISHLWEDESRYRRILEMLTDQESYTFNDFHLMQMDVQSPYAASVARFIVAALDSDSLLSPDEEWVANLLRNWDHRLYVTSVPATLYNVIYQHLLYNTLVDDLGKELLDSYLVLSNVPIRVMSRLLSDTTETWFDDVRTVGRETRDGIIRLSVRGALESLRREFGPEMREWRWGRLHTLTVEHPLGELRAFGSLLNVGPLPLGGSNTTVNNAGFSLRKPYGVLVGPVFRMIVDLASPDTCSVILSTGQSGQPLSRHYADQSVFWVNGVYHSFVTNVDAVRRSRWEKLLLQP